MVASVAGYLPLQYAIHSEVYMKFDSYFAPYLQRLLAAVVNGPSPNHPLSS